MVDRMIRLRNDEGNYETDVVVKDKYPDWEIDVEGKYVVEVSIELFLALAETQGLVPVPIPGGAQ